MTESPAGIYGLKMDGRFRYQVICEKCGFAAAPAMSGVNPTIPGHETVTTKERAMELATERWNMGMTKRDMVLANVPKSWFK